MQEAVVSPLTAWGNFYLILGAAAAALTGLVFVVVTLVAQTGARRSSQVTEAALGAFMSPTVMHFGVVLLVSALFSAPWPAIAPVSWLLSLAGLGGVVYTSIALRRVLVLRRVRRWPDYEPVLEDRLSYGVCPLAGYSALLIAALLLPGNPAPALFGIGAVVLLLLFVGIHNAWDNVTYIALGLLQPPDQWKEEQPARVCPPASARRQLDEQV